MNAWRALWTAMAVWAFIGWMYVVVRLLMYPDIAFNEPFIYGVPVAFWMMGIGTYLIGFVATWRALVDG